MGGEDDVIGRFLKKILYVGAFALIIGSFSTLADIIFRSFAGLGITAGGGAIARRRPAPAGVHRLDRLRCGQAACSTRSAS